MIPFPAELGVNDQGVLYAWWDVALSDEQAAYLHEQGLLMALVQQYSPVADTDE